VELRGKTGKKSNKMIGPVRNTCVTNGHFYDAKKVRPPIFLQHFEHHSLQIVTSITPTLDHYLEYEYLCVHASKPNRPGTYTDTDTDTDKRADLFLKKQQTTTKVQSPFRFSGVRITTSCCKLLSQETTYSWKPHKSINSP
jgi:hypothetical protein